MNLHVICIGNEILLGHTLNSNLAFLGELLSNQGHVVAREVCIPDTRSAIEATLRDCLSQADIVITVGGLGPTSDDITRPTVADALGLELEFDLGIYDGIKQRLAARGIGVPDQALRVQSMVPRGATVVPNPVGTAPGLWCQHGNVGVVMLPGPPREFQPMVTETVIPEIARRFPPVVRTHTIHTSGVPESVIAERVERFLAHHPRVTPAYCANPHMVDVRLTASADVAGLDVVCEALTTELGDAVLPEGCDSLPQAVGALLLSRGWTMATAESCTGGGIAAAITDVSGSSAYFPGSAVTYSNEWKHQLLGVRTETLASHGAVSAETAGEMLDGLVSRFGVNAGIAVTGVAGPTGGTPEKPVGLVFIGTIVQGQKRVERCQFPGDRRSVRGRTVISALNQLRHHIAETDAGHGA